ncbi:MAG: hypothetical protein AB7I35_01350 [Ramlibacter sp.]
MNIELITAPQFEPITLAQAKLAARVDGADEDALFTGVLIPGCTQDCEHLLQRAIMAQGLRVTLDRFPGSGVLCLPRPKLLSVDSVQYRDTAGAWQTLADDVYEVDTGPPPGRLQLALGAAWPSVYPMAGSVRVNFTAGYASGDEATQQAAVPASVKRWLLARVATAYDFRAELVAGASVMSLPNRFIGSALDRETFYGTGGF